MKKYPIVIKKKTFTDLLIKNIKLKFEYEMSSEVYAVAALLNVLKLSLWYTK